MTEIASTQHFAHQTVVGKDGEPGFDGAACCCGRREIESQLTKILGDPEFERNRSVSAFLKFVVDETLEGRGPRLKAFTVAMAVFHRDVNFDAQNNSIVRVQAARLRQLLHVFYAGPGAADPIRISMPLGGYAVKFEKTFIDPPEEEMAPAAPPPEPEPAAVQTQGLAGVVQAPAAPSRRPTPWILLFVLLGVASVFGGFFLLARTPAPQVAVTRALSASGYSPILVLSDDGAKGPGAKDLLLDARLRDAIRRGIGSFDNVQVAQQAIEGGAPPPLSYSLKMDSGQEDNGKLWFAFKLMHDPSGALIWSQAFSEIEPTNAGVEPVGTAVMRAIGDVYGALSSDVLSRYKTEMDKPRGYFCLLAAFDFIKDRAREKQIKAHDCLELEVAQNPDDARGLALLSIHLVRRYLDALPGSLGEDDLRRASELARRAYDRAPQRVRPVYSVFLSRFYDKRFDDAFLAADKVLEINPNSSVMTAQIGAAYVSRGQYERGEALLAGTTKMEQPTPRFLRSFLLLASYMHGDDSKFLELCRYASADGDPLGLLLQIASCNRSNDTKAAARAADILREKYPGVAADVPAALDRYAFIPEIQTKLLIDLAGATLGPGHAAGR